jgi:hypothetical protein
MSKSLEGKELGGSEDFDIDEGWGNPKRFDSKRFGRKMGQRRQSVPARGKRRAGKVARGSNEGQ